MHLAWWVGHLLSPSCKTGVMTFITWRLRTNEIGAWSQSRANWRWTFLASHLAVHLSGSSWVLDPRFPYSHSRWMGIRRHLEAETWHCGCFIFFVTSCATCSDCIYGSVCLRVSRLATRTSLCLLRFLFWNDIVSGSYVMCFLPGLNCSAQSAVCIIWSKEFQQGWFLFLLMAFFCFKLWN